MRTHTPARLAATLVLIGSALSATSASAAESKARDTRPVLALLNVKAGTGFDPEQAASIEALLLGALEETGHFRVIGRADIQTLLDLEAKKQAVNCDESTSCMTAIAGALGADFVASADVGRLGSTTVLAFRVIEVRTATVLVHARQTVDADAQLVHAVDLVVKQTVAALAVRAPERPVSPGHAAGIAAVVVGAIALVVGTGLGIAAQVQTTAARTPPPTSTAQSRIDGVNSLVTGAIIGWAGGGVVGAAGIGLLVVF